MASHHWLGASSLLGEGEGDVSSSEELSVEGDLMDAVRRRWVEDAWQPQHLHASILAHTSVDPGEWGRWLRRRLAAGQGGVQGVFQSALKVCCWL